MPVFVMALHEHEEPVECRLDGEITVDSAGTGAWHIGNTPDERASAAALARGVSLEGRARQVLSEDYDRFDLLIGMDRSNVADLISAGHAPPVEFQPSPALNCKFTSPLFPIRTCRCTRPPGRRFH